MFLRPRITSETLYRVETFVFQKPCRFEVAGFDGTRVLTGYGIGETIEVVMPVAVTLAIWRDEVDYLDLPDGSKAFRVQGEVYDAKWMTDYSTGRYQFKSLEEVALDTYLCSAEHADYFLLKLHRALKIPTNEQMLNSSEG